MNERPVTVTLAQIIGAPYDPAANRERTIGISRRAFADGADIVVLPELIVPGYVADPDRLRPIAEPLNGPTVEAWREVAAETGGYVCGGFCERDGERLFNTAVVVGPAGVELHYRKLHPFAAEKECFAPGDLGLPVAELSFGTVGLCVCYDLRFVETLRALSLQGAELVCVPTAWIAGFDRERWDEHGMAPQANGVVLQANLDQVFVACASQVGPGEDAEFLGSSILAGPTGGLVAGPLPGSSEEIAGVTIDLAAVEAAQHRSELITPRQDRRTDVYGIAVGETVL